MKYLLLSTFGWICAREDERSSRGCERYFNITRWSGSEHLRVKCHKDYTTWWCTGEQYHLVGKLTYRTIEVSHVVRPNECVCHHDRVCYHYVCGGLIIVSRSDMYSSRGCVVISPGCDISR